MRPICMLICVSLVCLFGCTMVHLPKGKRPVSSTPAAAKPVPEAASVASVPTSAAAPAVRAKQGGKGIRVDSIRPISTNVASNEGVYLGNQIKAFHLCSGELLNSWAISEPRYGSVKAYATGHFRYYPPRFACEDSLEVRLFAKDGCYRVVSLPIKVVKRDSKLAAPPAAPSKPVIPAGSYSRYHAAGRVSLRITSPVDGSKSRRSCMIRGVASGISAETVLDATVVSHWGAPYKQSYHPVVKTDGTFEGWVFLGDEFGNGIGEEFQIYVTDRAGHKSNEVTVKRER